MNLLLSLLNAGNTADGPLPAFRPPPNYIAFIATLAVHPTLTTRARSQKQIEESNLALRYLRLFLKVVGPVNGKLDEAFVFSRLGTSSRRGGSGRRRVPIEDSSPTGIPDDGIENDLARGGAIWAQAEDIWQVVGWAFNCSAVHKKRWARWRVWVEHMLDVFEQDWETRGLLLDGQTRLDEEDDDDPREASMIVKSLSADGTTTGRERKIVRAIFADGSSRSAAEFPEIWKNETKERKTEEEPIKMASKIDIEADNYGDYLDDDADSDFEESDPDQSGALSKTPHKLSSLPPKPTDLSAPLGGTAAINLRLRFLSLLSAVATTMPWLFTTIGGLYDSYLEHIRPLSIPTFFMLISPSSLRLLSPSAASSLTQYILRSLITTAAPLPAGDDLTQEAIETSYLPFTANTSSVADNTKVSLCVETLLRLLDHHVGLAWTPTLQDALDRGIAARDAKATKVSKKRVHDASSADERIWLRASADRMKILVLAAKV